MMWLVRFFILLFVLLTAGSNQRTVSKSPSDLYSNLEQQYNFLKNTKYTPLQPERDSRTFQIADNEEDDITSKVKKSAPYAILIFSFLSISGLLSIFQSRVKNRAHNSSLTLNSYPLYIQLRTIRI
jgi:hypothetical protein